MKQTAKIEFDLQILINFDDIVAGKTMGNSLC